MKEIDEGMLDSMSGGINGPVGDALSSLIEELRLLRRIFCFA